MADSSFKIIRVPFKTPSSLPNATTNAFIIGNAQESILVDAGYDQPETRTLLDKLINENNFATPKAVIITHAHPDHAPGIRQLLDWSPVVYCHPFEEKATLGRISPLNNISLINDGDKVEVAKEDITILHAPGHTQGHLCIYIPSEQILLTGDNIVAEGTSWIGPPDGDMTDYFQTLNRLKKLKLSKIGPGHGDWILNPDEQIDFVLNRRLSREKQILRLLKEHPKLTVENLTNMIYDQLPSPLVIEVAKKTTEAHLIKLIKEELVTLKKPFYSLK